MPSTWSIRKNGVPSTSPVVLHPPHPGDRDVGQFADQPDHLELVVQPVRREDRDVLGSVGATRATHFCSVGVPSSSHRPVRMMVSEDIPLESTPLSTVTSGATPPGMTVDSHCDITAGQRADVPGRVLQAADVFDSRFVGHRFPLLDVITIR